MKYIWPFIIMLFMFGCHNGKNYGGIGSYNYHEKTVFPDGKISERSISGEIAQPDSPSGEGQLKFESTEKGLNVNYTMPQAHDDVATSAKFDLLKVPIYIGGGLILLGLAVFLIFRQTMWALIISGTGIGMIVGSYLLAEYAIYFLLGLIVLLGYGVYLLWDYIVERRSNSENTKLVQAAKKLGIVNSDKFAELANELQSSSTKKKVRKIKGK